MRRISCVCIKRIWSSNVAASAGIVKLWPKELTFESYEFVLSKGEFLASLWITVKRVVLGTCVSMILTILIAFPLSKGGREPKFRTGYAWFFVFTILFSGGLIPWYMTVRATGLLDSIWALVIPGAVPVFNVILLLNFFRGLPKELEEAAFVDGAGYWTTLWRIYVPLSMPSLATIMLFTIVGHWNSWFDGLVLMNSQHNYPLSSYLQTVIVQASLTNMSAEQLANLASVSDRTVKAAQIFVGALPILAFYPFIQKYFVKGMVIGGVKE
ncbi:carbohydrate ABC transporter permease [Paenibacillus sp. LHD-38]|uniref:carbohydrate ABC transporter permease n=1 Tax=Paenibacillus sp. LHD-38 TaxID=3072143 RepID=UPI00280CC7E0|nr:carbohydrate ABC transporter permease [Paenibacillus sp. LHD-38]MDQ8738464.1 carbohydrate ABC transporter permease [Paenibacillus sp. LHD-38]